MKREQIIKSIKEKEPDFLERAKKKGYICPACGNGSGQDGTGITLDPGNDGRHYKCFKCGLNADTIELYQQSTGTDFNKALQDLGKRYGINTQGTYEPIKPAAKTVKEPPVDYSDFLKRAAAANDYKYLEGRGISETTQKRFCIGYVESWKHPRAQNAPETPRCIIPTSKYSYTARDTRENIKGDANKYSKMHTGPAHLFNGSTLTKAHDTPIFVTEGEIDAMSIIEVGGEAIGLGSTSNTNLLYKGAKAGIVYLILALDNDKAGSDTTRKLEEGLSAAGIDYYSADTARLYSGAKDANEALQKDREALKTNVAEVIRLASRSEAEKVEEAQETYNELHNGGKLLQGFVDRMEDRKRAQYTSTGFRKLDIMLGGGLREGLTILGARPGAGKTSFTLQIARNAAKTGRKVLLFELEMGKDELIARSISCETLGASMNANGNADTAQTEMNILKGQHFDPGLKHYYRDFTIKEQSTVLDAMAAFEEYADNLYIYEAVAGFKASMVYEIIKQFTALFKERPIVIVDYLQILEREDPHDTDKAAIDGSIRRLKTASRDFQLPIICIASYNRESNKNGKQAKLESLSGSAGIEYGADTVLSLDYRGANEKDFDLDAAQKKNPRELILRTNKNRSNGFYFTGLNFFSQYAYFEEVATEDKPATGARGSGAKARKQKAEPFMEVPKEKQIEF